MLIGLRTKLTQSIDSGCQRKKAMKFIIFSKCCNVSHRLVGKSLRNRERWWNFLRQYSCCEIKTTTKTECCIVKTCWFTRLSSSIADSCVIQMFSYQCYRNSVDRWQRKKNECNGGGGGSQKIALTKETRPTTIGAGSASRASRWHEKMHITCCGRIIAVAMSCRWELREFTEWPMRTH